MSVSVLLAAASMAAVAQGGDAARYEVLVERNIFSSTRGEQREPPEPESTSHPAEPPREREPADPARAMVLRGVAMRGEQAVAMVETAGGMLHRVAPGDTVAGRRVVRIDIDQLVLERGGELQTIAIGMTLTGEAAPTPARRAEVENQREGASGRPGRDGDVLERMRRRRQEAIGDGGEAGRSTREQQNDAPKRVDANPEVDADVEPEFEVGAEGDMPLDGDVEPEAEPRIGGAGGQAQDMADEAEEGGGDVENENENDADDEADAAREEEADKADDADEAGD